MNAHISKFALAFPGQIPSGIQDLRWCVGVRLCGPTETKTPFYKRYSNPRDDNDFVLFFNLLHVSAVHHLLSAIHFNFCYTPSIRGVTQKSKVQFGSYSGLEVTN